MINPAIIGEAINVAGSVGQGITDVAVAYSDPRGVQRNRRMLAELQRREALNLLGLTPEEMALAQQQSMGAARSAVAGQQAEMTRRVQGSALGGAADVAALAGQDAALQALAETQGTIGTQLTEADIAARLQQEQEMEARAAFDAQVRANRARAVGNLLTGGLIGAGGAAQTATTLGISPGQAAPAAMPAVQFTPESEAQDAALRELGYDLFQMSRY